MWNSAPQQAMFKTHTLIKPSTNVTERIRGNASPHSRKIYCWYRWLIKWWQAEPAWSCTRVRSRAPTRENDGERIRCYAGTRGVTRNTVERRHLAHVRHTTWWWHEYARHTRVAFKAIMAGELSVEEFFGSKKTPFNWNGNFFFFNLHFIYLFIYL